MKVIHLRTGWNDVSFEDIIQKEIDFYKKVHGWEYYDIKISSNGNNCLLIFREAGK